MVLEIIKSCDEAILHEPENIQVIRLRGLMYNVAGEYDNAIRDFEQIIQSQPLDTVAHYLKSDCHYNKKEYNLAKRSYMRALKTQYDTKFTEDDIRNSVMLDDQDMIDIKTVIEHEKNQAILDYFQGLNFE